MKILLVQPSKISDYIIDGKKKPFIRTLTLPYLAALTPPEVEIEIVEETVEEINFNGPYDLIGITASTSQVFRAYQIANEFRKRGKKVVMGGIHVTALPEEAIKHCDAVVIGEAENVWTGLLADYKSGRLKQFYKSERFHDLQKIPIPRFDLLKGGKFFHPFVPVQASRGCPHNCEFCSVTKFFGQSYRFRPVEDVINEIKASGAGEFTFVDDNITANKRYSMELFTALKPLKIRWIGQSTINLGRDPELCKLAAESGCYFMGIGIESVDQENLLKADKSWNKVSEFPRLLDTIRTHGIGLVLNMIVGLDSDDDRVFDKTLSFLMRNGAFYLVLNTPIPYPQTKLALRLEREGRLLHKDWANYTHGSVVFSPRHMTPETLKQGYWRLLNDFFSYTSIVKRSFYQSRKNILFYFERNIDLHRMVKRRAY